MSKIAYQAPGGAGWICRIFAAVALCWTAHAGRPAPAQVTAAVEAISGQPFGVGRVTLTFPPATAAPTSAQVSIEDDNGRVLYPVVSAAPVRRLLGDLLNERSLLGALARDLPTNVNIYFLFHGEGPFRVTVSTPARYQVAVTPRAPFRDDNRLLRDWWQQYSLAAREQMQQSDYPPVVETYLTNMLSRRLGLNGASLRLEPRSTTRIRDALDLLAGFEELRRDVMVETLRSAGPAEEASLPPPKDIAWPASPPREAPADVAIEPIAMRIPEDCFYIRFGDIANFIWLHHLTEEHGGDLGRLIALRGHDSHAMQRMEQRLALRYSQLLDLIGAHVVDDLAIFGSDTYLQEGAAIGVVIKAKNSFLVSAALTSERGSAQLREKERGAKTESLEIAGRQVSFLSTPDNRLRSFFVQEGEYFLLSTSQALVEQFFAAGDGKHSLGASEDFRYARSLLPVSREDSIFAYFSPAFFRRLVGPHYQIELRRRLRATTDLELVQMAQLAAQAEGRPAATIDDLIRHGFLPPGFDQRPDGSHVEMDGDRLRDSLRGTRGNFLPIPDTPLISVTPSEAQHYTQTAETWAYQWRQMDPVAIGIQRSPRGKDNVEKIAIDAYATAFFEEKYGPFLAVLGEPIAQAMAPVEGNLISAEISLQGGEAARGVPPHLLFLGVQDSPRSGLQGWPGLIKPVAFLRTIPGYLGATPKPGFVDLLPLGLAPPPDAQGFSQLPLGVWRREVGEMSLLSFDPKLLASITPQLRVVEETPPAQARVRIGDLVASKNVSWINEFFHGRARQASEGNLHLMEMLSKQLRVPPENALAEAQRILDVELVCPLGGEYQYAPSPNGGKRWTSTALNRTAADYQPPLLGWLRGANARLTKTEEQITVHADVTMQRKSPSPTIKLPGIPFFSSP